MLFAIDGPSWKNRRINMNSYFNQKNINKFLDNIVLYSERSSAFAIEKGVFDCKEIFIRTTFGFFFLKNIVFIFIFKC